MKDLTWVEISKDALTYNIRQFRNIVGPDVILAPCVKANAYGHGLVETARTFLAAGADWLCVDKLFEAKILREAGVDSPIYVMGYIALEDLEEAVGLDLRVIIYNTESVEELARINKHVKVHLKVETGNNRQGLCGEELLSLAKKIQQSEKIEIEGLATHFANIEDTTDHSYAKQQIERFDKEIEMLKKEGIEAKIHHCANSAATALFKNTHFNMVRPGISSYGMWPSNETHISFLKEVESDFTLHPAFSWKSSIAQIKTIPAGEYIGYGCTYRSSHETRLAILPVGYYDGYDRGVNGGYVLINGQRAPIRGRICMNIMMVEVSDISDIKLEDEVVLIGRSGEEVISVETFAKWAGTINYEITTRVNERITRNFL